MIIPHTIESNIATKQKYLIQNYSERYENIIKHNIYISDQNTSCYETDK